MKNKIPLKITVSSDGMTIIEDVSGENNESKHLNYGNILGMYKTESTQGVSLQTNSSNKELNKKILERCNEIATASYELQNLLKQVEEQQS